VTPYPVTTAWQRGDDYTQYRCLPGAINYDSVEDAPHLHRGTSPWSTPQNCWWPLDLSEERVCKIGSGGGRHVCAHSDDALQQSEWTWCGSDYDAAGNPRFAGETVIEGRYFTMEQLNRNATYVQSLNWGYTHFDNIFGAFLTVFQSITKEGWTDIMYM
jgi:voltage-dependent calcium channel L type alpha-1D